MIINKITTGFVIQQFDTEKNQFVSQNFTAGEVEYENQNGEPVDAPNNEPYLSFDMVQPEI